MLLYVDSLFSSPYAMSAYVGLHEKGLSFDTETIDLAAKRNHAPDFSSASITRRVPTLLHDGFALSDRRGWSATRRANGSERPFSAGSTYRGRLYEHLGAVARTRRQGGNGGGVS